MPKYESREARIEAQRKPRVCLGCGRKFASEGPHNRLCWPCSQITAPLVLLPRVSTLARLGGGFSIVE